MNNSQSKIVKAFKFAYMNHAGTTRKATQVPFIVHPIEVAVSLMKSGASEDVVVAGLLHDIVEEEGVEFVEIEKEFGKRVAQLVDHATEPEELRKGDSKKTWDKRKQHTIDKIKAASKEEKLLSCADKLANIRDIVNDHERMGDQLWEIFNAPVEKQRWYYQSLCKAFTEGEGITSYSVYKQYEESVYKLFK